MKTILQCCFWLAVSMSLPAEVLPHIGFVYPAGGNPGATIKVTIGGQYLRDFSGLYLSGTQLETGQPDYLRIYDKREAGGLRRRQEALAAKIEGETDAKIRVLIQQQMDLMDQEMSMVAQVRREERKTPGLAAKKQFNPQIAERTTLELTLPEDMTPGEYELRVMTTNGLSNPLVFEVGKVQEVSENEPNNLPAKAKDLPGLPVLVNGQIMPGDVDSFRFAAKEGQTLVFRARARALVPYLADAVPGWFQAVLTLYDAQGNEIACNDDFRFDPDPVLIYKIPADGDYILSIRDSIYRGREDFVYRVSIGETPFIQQIFPLGGKEGGETDVSLSGVNLPVTRMKIKTGFDAEIRPVQVGKDGQLSNVRAFSVSPLPDMPEAEPNNGFSKPQNIPNEIIINGTIGTPGDQDWFCFEGREGEKKTIEVIARRLGSPLDARIILMNAKQDVLASNDDAEDKSEGLLTHYADSRIDYTLPEDGTFFIRLDDLQNKGGDDFSYRLAVKKEKPDFRLRIVPSGLCVPQNGTAIATVHAIRTGGFTGEIQLSALNAPPGIEIERAVIPAGMDSARIIISAKSRSQKQLIPLEIEGSADCGFWTVTHRAVPAEDMMQAFIYRHWVPAQQLLIRVSDPQRATVSLTFPRNGVFQIRPGSEIEIPATVKWNDRTPRKITLALAEPPEWLTLKDTSLSGRGGTITLVISPNAEPGDTATVLLNGTVRVQKSPDDPDYNPVMKYLNAKKIDFTIDALPIQITN